MRALSACLTVVLGLGVAAIGACSSTASDDGAAGSGGTSAGGTSAGGTSSGGSSTAGKGGSSTAGTSSAAGDTGAAGAAGSGACTFESEACTGCMKDKCGSELDACTGTPACATAVFQLDGCLCSGSSSAAECETTFISDGGTKGKALADCFDANCKTVCE